MTFYKVSLKAGAGTLLVSVPTFAEVHSFGEQARASRDEAA